MDPTPSNADALNPKHTDPDGLDPKQGLAAWLQAISHETAPMMNDGRTSKELLQRVDG